jgi:hypothetical protein
VCAAVHEVDQEPVIAAAGSGQVADDRLFLPADGQAVLIEPGPRGVERQGIEAATDLGSDRLDDPDVLIPAGLTVSLDELAAHRLTEAAHVFLGVNDRHPDQRPGPCRLTVPHAASLARSRRAETISVDASS